MARMGMIIDLDLCIGCDSCTIACKQENNIPIGDFWSKVNQIGPTGVFPELEQYFLPVLCQHCDDAHCVNVCPTGASYQREDVVVLIDHDKCIGCKYCVMACPYGVRYYNEDQGVIEKCTLCAHRLEVGQVPACVETCVASARIFGDLDDPNSEISKKLAQGGNNVHRLADIGNSPSVHYILSPKIAEWRSS